MEREQREDIQKGEGEETHTATGPQGLHCYVTRVLPGVLLQLPPEIWRRRGGHTFLFFFFSFETSDVTATGAFLNMSPLKCFPRRLSRAATGRSSMLFLCRFPAATGPPPHLWPFFPPFFLTLEDSNTNLPSKGRGFEGLARSHSRLLLSEPSGK